MASTRPAARADRSSRLTLAAMTVAGMAMLLWLVVSLAANAFG